MIENRSGKNLDAWEQKGRSVNSAAFFALLIVGILFFYGQTFLIIIATIARKMFSGPSASFGKDPLLAGIPSLRLMSFFSQYLIILLPSWLLLNRWHTDRIPVYTRFKSVSPMLIILSVLGTIALMPTSIAISTALIRKLGIPEKIISMNDSFVASRSPLEFAWVLMVVAVTPALCEEFFFRGHFQRTLERTLGWKSVLVAGIIFGMFHFRPLGLVSLSALGIYFGYVFYRSGSILTSMIAHFTNNALILYADYRPTAGDSWFSEYIQNISMELLAGSILAAIAIITVFHRMTERKTEALEEAIAQDRSISMADSVSPAMTETPELSEKIMAFPVRPSISGKSRRSQKTGKRKPLTKRVRLKKPLIRKRVIKKKPVLRKNRKSPDRKKR